MPFPEITYSEPEPTAEQFGHTYASPEGEPVSPEGEPEYLTKDGGGYPEAEPSAATISDPTTMAIMSAIAGLLSCGIILENLVVLFVIARRWPKQNPNITYFIVHLACADLISGFQFLWFNCIDVHVRMTHEGYWVLALCGLWMVTIGASVGGLLNFASLRIHALKNAMKNEKFSQRRAAASIIISWSFPIFALFLPPLLGWNCINATPDQFADCSQAVFPFTKAYVLLLACLLILSMVCLAAYYISIYILVRTRLRSVKAMSTNTTTVDTEKRLFTTMVIILVLFFICQAPVAGVMIADFIVESLCEGLVDAFQITLTFSFINSLLNPLIYYWGMPATRDAFWIAFGAKHKTRRGQRLSSISRTKEKSDVYGIGQNSIIKMTQEKPKVGLQ